MEENRLKATDIFKLLPSILVTLGIVAFWYEPFLALWMAVGHFWITLPVLLAAGAFFGLSLKMKTVGQKVISFYGFFNILLLVAYLVVALPQQSCDADTMDRHYRKHAADFDELCRYTIDALDDSCGISLEWKHGRLNRFGIESHGQVDRFSNEEAIAKQDSLMQIVGLTHEELDGIHQRVKKARCIGINVSYSTFENWHHTFYPSAPHAVTILFRYIGFGRYDFLIKDSAFTDDEMAVIMNDLTLIPYNDRVIFQYGGGAVGPQTFGKDYRDKYIEKYKPGYSHQQNQ